LARAISVALSKVWVCGRLHAGNAGSNPAGGMDVSCKCCELSGRGLCVELITRTEESYRLWYVYVSSPSFERGGHDSNKSRSGTIFFSIFVLKKTFVSRLGYSCVYKYTSIDFINLLTTCIHNETANGLQNVINGRFYFQNCVRFYSTRVNVISFYP